jgi:endo-alpha-N-acetylgalactosaminidase
VISGNDGADAIVSQVITGLKPRKTYAAEVWVQIKGNRTASFEILPIGIEGIKPISNYITKTDVRHGMACDPRKGTNYQRLVLLFDIPSGCSKAQIYLKAAKGSPSTVVEFDGLRIAETKRSPEAAKHWFYEDFESTALGGFVPFTCNFGERTHLTPNEIGNEKTRIHSVTPNSFIEYDTPEKSLKISHIGVKIMVSSGSIY